MRKNLLSLTIIIVLLASLSSTAQAVKPLVITAPSDGETVSGTYLVMGGGDGNPVEVSIDYTNWEPAARLAARVGPTRGTPPFIQMGPTPSTPGTPISAARPRSR